MTKEELRARYARVPSDFSEIEMLKNQLLESGLLDVAQINPENAGKVLKIGEDGSIELGEGGGGSDLPVYDFSDDKNATIADLINTVGEVDKIECILKFFTWGRVHEYQCKLTIDNVFSTNYAVMIYMDDEDRYTSLYVAKFLTELEEINLASFIISGEGGSKTIETMVPSPNTLDSSKTYSLIKPANQNMQWQEASGGGTKLYKHSLSDGTNTYEFICTLSEQFVDTGTSLISKIAQCWQAVPQDATMFLCFVYQGGNTLGVKLLNCNNASIESSTFDSANYTDTVTAL